MLSRTQQNKSEKLTQIHASVIYQIPWIRWISVTFRENSIIISTIDIFSEPIMLCDNSQHVTVNRVIMTKKCKI